MVKEVKVIWGWILAIVLIYSMLVRPHLDNYSILSTMSTETNKDRSRGMYTELKKDQKLCHVRNTFKKKNEVWLAREKILRRYNYLQTIWESIRENWVNLSCVATKDKLESIINWLEGEDWSHRGLELIAVAASYLLLSITWIDSSKY